jgi:hypothetical protein
LKKKIFLDESDRLEGGEENKPRWNDYRLVSRKVETPRIYSLEFEAVSPSKNSLTTMPGSHIRVKLGDQAKLVRAYSVVGGIATVLHMVLPWKKSLEVVRNICMRN